MVTIVKCPTCRRELAWSTDNTFRPFCSERCRLIDLGAWFAEQRALPADEDESESERETELAPPD